MDRFCYWYTFRNLSLLQIKSKPNCCPENKVRNFVTTKQLIKHPYSGQIEFNLEKLKEGHRYLVQGNYKIIYKEVKEGILITDVFDTRQDPVKINDEKRNSNE